MEKNEIFDLVRVRREYPDAWAEYHNGDQGKTHAVYDLFDDVVRRRAEDTQAVYEGKVRTAKRLLGQLDARQKTLRREKALAAREAAAVAAAERAAERAAAVKEAEKTPKRVRTPEQVKLLKEVYKERYRAARQERLEALRLDLPDGARITIRVLEEHILSLVKEIDTQRGVIERNIEHYNDKLTAAKADRARVGKVAQDVIAQRGIQTRFRRGGK